MTKKTKKFNELKIPEVRKGTLKQKIDRIDKILGRFEGQDEKKVKKKFKLRFSIKISAKGKIRKGYMLVILMRTNGQIDFKFLPVQNDMIEIKENMTFHLASTQYVFRYKQYPTIILPEWSLEPLCPKLLYKKTVEEGKVSWPQKVIINAIEMAQIKSKKQFGGMMVLGIIIAIIVALYLITTAISG